jgi:Concanavalin A-like lectin/glucanases superfamily
MKKIYLISFLIFYALCLNGQPTVLGTQLVDGNYTRYNLNSVGAFKQYRLQATNSASSSSRNWEFAQGTAASTNYSTVWRPILENNTLSTNTFIPTSYDNGAKYNTSFGGSSGLLPAITANNYYTFNVSSNAASDNVMALLETSYNPTAISSVSQLPTAPTTCSGATTITVTMASAPASGENVFVRYTTDDFVTSSLVLASFSGATGTVSIPAQAASTTVKYYVFSSNVSAATIITEYDMFTLNLNNNAGANWTYATVSGSSVSGSIAGGATVCSGTNNTTLTLSGYTGSIVKWQSSTNNFTSTPTDIVNTNTTLTATNLAVTTYYRAVVQGGSCAAANSSVATLTVSNTCDDDGDGIYNQLDNCPTIANANQINSDTIAALGAWLLNEGTGTTVTAINGTTTATVTNPQWVAGRNGLSALNFTTGNEVVTTTLPIVGKSAVTLAAWIKTTVSGQGSAYILSVPRGASGNNGFDIGLNGSVIRCVFYSSTGSFITPSSTQTYADGNWHHIAATYDGNNVKLYWDGSLQTTTAATGNLLSDGDQVFIGRFGSGTSYNYQGYIDEPFVTDRALSATEIAKLASTGFSDNLGNACDTDDDDDGTLDTADGCPLDKNKTAPGLCGCGVPETPVNITNHPSTAMANYFQNAPATALSITATGAGLTYQWYSNASNNNTSGTSVGSSNGGQTNSYTPSTTSVGTTYYYCVVGGSCPTTSNVSGAIIVVNLAITAFNMTGGGTYCSGGAGVPVGLVGSESGVSYQLKVDGADVGIPISGTGSALSFGNQTAAGVYTVLATSGSFSILITDNGTTPQMPASGLMAHYPFSGNANDASSFGNNGTVSNAILTTDRFGNTNAAYAFNGSNSIITAPDAPQLRPKNLTLSHWAYVNNVPDTRVMVSKSFLTSNCEAYTTYVNDNNFNAVSCDAVSSGSFTPFINTTKVIGAWKYITYIVDNDNSTVKLYLDGILKQSETLTNLIAFDDSPLQIGAENETGTVQYYFDGSLDDIRIYNRVLSNSEIKALFEEGTSKTVVSIQPISAPTISLKRTASNTIRATVGNVGVTPTYQWQKNSIAVASNTTPILMDNTLAVNDVITCTVTTTESCYTPTSATTTLTILNDECTDATTLSSGVETNGTTIDATPTTSINPAPDVWYKITPSVTGTLKVEVEGLSMFNTDLRIYSGTCGSLVNAMVFPYYNYGAVNNQGYFSGKDQTIINVTSGTTYYIRVAHFQSNVSGDFKIRATQYSPPANNACSNAITLSDQVTTNGNTEGARDLGSLNSQCGLPIVRNVWYKYTPTQNCALQVQVSPSSGADIHLSVLTSACTAPTFITLSPSNSSCVANYLNIDQSFVATAGVTYYFSVKSGENYYGFYDGPFSIKVTESNLAAINLKSGAPSSICSGGFTTLQVDIKNLTAVTNYTLVYSDGSSSFTVSNYVPLTDIVVSPTGNRTYTLVSVTPTSGGTAIGNLYGSVPIVVNAPVTPSVSIAASPTNVICPGANVTFTAMTLNTGGGSINYNFKKGGTSIQSGASNTYSNNALANNDIITCEITITSGACLLSNTATSNSITMNVSTDCTPRLNAKVFIEGAYNSNTGLMNDGLMVNNKVPTNQPYNTLSFSGVNYEGTEQISQYASLNQGGNVIVDWILIELRNATTPSTIVAKRAALLQRDGDIVDVDGTSSVEFTDVPIGTYHVVIRHRLCLATRTATAVSLLNGNVISLNFTNNSNALSGSMKSLSGGVYALYSGDTDRDGDIDTMDYANVRAWNPTPPVYFNYGDKAFDTDFNNKINVSDVLKIRENISINQVNINQ